MKISNVIIYDTAGRLNVDGEMMLEIQNLKDKIKEHVKQNLAAHEYPRLIEFVEELPLTTTGKN